MHKNMFNKNSPYPQSHTMINIETLIPITERARTNSLLRLHCTRAQAPVPINELHELLDYEVEYLAKRVDNEARSRRLTAKVFSGC